MNVSSITVEQLKRAIQIKEQIQELQLQLAKLVGGQPGTESISRPSKKMSAAGRARIAAAQKARWARFKAENPSKAVKKTQGFMSDAARAKIAAAAKARWAKAKAAGKKTL